MLISSPVMAVEYNVRRDTLDTDISDVKIGCFLLQKELNGAIKPIGHGRARSPAHQVQRRRNENIFRPSARYFYQVHTRTTHASQFAQTTTHMRVY